jgi:NitT/TauT family transport system substrate-binding protein
MPEYVFPQSWVANPTVLKKDEDLILRFIRAWNKANDYRIDNLDEAVKLTVDFTQVPEDSLTVQLDTTQWLKSSEIKSKYEDETIYSWYENLEKLFVETEKMKEVVPAKDFVAGDIYLKSFDK